MFSTSGSGLTASDVLSLTDRNNDGFGGGCGWWLIILFALIFGWGNGGYGAYGGMGSGSQINYTLASDFATIQRQLSDGFGATESKLDAVNNGICSLGYDQLGQMNGINTNILTSSNAIQTQLADCCCKTQTAIADVNYNIATQANGITNAVNQGFCQTNFNAQTNTRDIVDSQNAGTRAILDKLSQMESNAKDEKIAELTARNSDLRFEASQVAQNSFIQNLVRPQINPCYITQNPYCSCGNANNFYGYPYGTTIA